MKMKLVIATVALTFSALASASSAKLAYGQHHYGKADSRELTALVKDLSAENGLSAVEYKSGRNSQVTKYKVLKFEKELDKSGDFRLVAYTDGNESKTYIKLGAEYTSTIQDLINDLKREAHFIDTYQAGMMMGSGSSYGARNLSNVESISLVCKTEVFRDGSGGDSCFTRADKLDLSAPGVKFFLSTVNGEKDLSKLDWNNKVFNVSAEQISLNVELFMLR